jgi:hypothetical protein
VQKLSTQLTENQVPYYAWDNREPGFMKVWISDAVDHSLYISCRNFLQDFRASLGFKKKYVQLVKSCTTFKDKPASAGRNTKPQHELVLSCDEKQM